MQQHRYEHERLVSPYGDAGPELAHPTGKRRHERRGAEAAHHGACPPAVGGSRPPGGARHGVLAPGRGGAGPALGRGRGGSDGSARPQSPGGATGERRSTLAGSIGGGLPGQTLPPRTTHSTSTPPPFRDGTAHTWAPPSGDATSSTLSQGIGRQASSTTMPSRPSGRRHIAVGRQSSPPQQDTPYLSLRPEYQPWAPAGTGARQASAARAQVRRSRPMAPA